MLGVVEPAGSVGDEAHRAHLGEPVGERVDVAVDAVHGVDLLGHPVGRNPAAPGDEAENGERQIGVGGGRGLAIIGNLAGFPEPCDVGGGLGVFLRDLVAARRLQRELVHGGGRAGEARLVRGLLQRMQQGADGGKIQLAVAPLQKLDRLEAVILDRLDQFLLEGRAAARRPEGAVIHVASRATGDLSEFGRGEAPVAPAVEFPVGGEGDVIHVEIEPHADGVGGDDVIDVAGLEQLHLGVAGARAERAEHHGRAAPLALDPFRDGVDLLGREGDDGGARRQAGNLLVARESQSRQARACEDRRAGEKLADQRLHRAGADQQRLLPAAPAQQTVGEDVAAIEIGAELDLVDRQKIHVDVARHGLDGGDPVGGRARFDLLLARDERDIVLADLRHDAVVDLAREQAQRQADGARREREHALDGVMGLAGVGRAEHGRDACGGGAASGRERRHGGPVASFLSFDRRSGRRRLISELRSPREFTFRTGDERIAAESAPPAASRFVPRYIVFRRGLRPRTCRRGAMSAASGATCCQAGARAFFACAPDGAVNFRTRGRTHRARIASPAPFRLGSGGNAPPARRRGPPPRLYAPRPRRRALTGPLLFGTRETFARIGGARRFFSRKAWRHATARPGVNFYARPKSSVRSRRGVFDLARRPWLKASLRRGFGPRPCSTRFPCAASAKSAPTPKRLPIWRRSSSV